MDQRENQRSNQENINMSRQKAREPRNNSQTAAQGERISDSYAYDKAVRENGSSAQTENRRAQTGGRRTGNAPNRTDAQRRIKNRRARIRQRNQRLLLIILIVLLIAAVGGFFIWNKFGPSNEKADLKQYYGLVNDEDLAVVVNNQIIRGENGVSAAKEIDGQIYVEYSVIRDWVNKRFYWDPNENVLLYTLPTGNVSVGIGNKDYTEIMEKKSEEYVILKSEGRTAYIAIPFVKQYTDLEYQVYDEPKRIVITSDFEEKTTADLKRGTKVRYQGDNKSPVLTVAGKKAAVTVLEENEKEKWQKISTEDGFVGYVPKSALKNRQQVIVEREFEPVQYSNLSVNHTINMAWHNVAGGYANSSVLGTIADTKGLTTIAPTWFSIGDTEGNLHSIADSSYVNYAHQSNLDVWATLRDFDGGTNSREETYQVLSYTSKRERLVNQVIAEALQTGVDGINLDFELVSPECGEHYIQFVRELSVKCRQNRIVFSIANYVPQSDNKHYDLEEQAIMADYVIIMGYDEHTEGSYTAGSVASYGYLKQGIEDALRAVPNEKLVAAVPFYTRLWFETPKTEEELAAEEGTEAAKYTTKVSSTVKSMDDAVATIQQAGAQTVWDEEARQNYAQWDADGGTYKIWLEDRASLEEKLKLIKSEKLAGVAEWKLGRESKDIWELILQYVN